MLDNARRYELVVRPRGRTPADEYYHNGAIWIEGREGNNYTIDVRNNTPIRALFIISVDGLDVITGQPAGPQSQGYVVGPHQTLSIPGWKIDYQQAAEFIFSQSRDSYVNAIGGTTTNTGVIGAMVFSEYQQMVIEDYYMSPRRNGTSIHSTEVKTSGGILRSMVQTSDVASSHVTQDVGTGFGQSTEWQTHTTKFRRANPDHPDALMALYYNTARNLEKMGIRLRKKRDVSYQANPFPGYSSTGCKPPPGWSE